MTRIPGAVGGRQRDGDQTTSAEIGENAMLCRWATGMQNRRVTASALACRLLPVPLCRKALAATRPWRVATAAGDDAAPWAATLRRAAQRRIRRHLLFWASAGRPIPAPAERAVKTSSLWAQTLRRVAQGRFSWKRKRPPCSKRGVSLRGNRAMNVGMCRGQLMAWAASAGVAWASQRYTYTTRGEVNEEAVCGKNASVWAKKSEETGENCA